MQSTRSSQNPLISALAISLVFATAAPALAAPVFGPATTLQLSGCFGNPNVPTGSLSANPVNSGAGVSLSGSASVSTDTTLCMQLEWGGSMSGSVDSIVDIPIAWDFTVSVTDQTQPIVSTDIYIEFSHEPYVTGGFNQGGYAYGTSFVGPGRITSPQNLGLTWNGPPAGNPRAFTSYYVRMMSLYENINEGNQTLSLAFPGNTSIDLGHLRGGTVPEPPTLALLGLCLAGLAFSRRKA